MKRVLATFVLAALAAGPWVGWPCLHSCAPDSQPAAASSACHGPSRPLPHLSAVHNCDGHVSGLTVVAKRTESVSAGVAMPRVVADVAPSDRLPAGPTIDRVAAGPPSPSRVIPLRI